MSNARIIVKKEDNKPIKSVMVKGKSAEEVVEDYTKYSIDEVFIVDSDELSVEYSHDVISSDFKIFEDGEVVDNRDVFYKYVFYSSVEVHGETVEKVEGKKVFSEEISESEVNDLKGFFGADTYEVFEKRRGENR